MFTSIIRTPDRVELQNEKRWQSAAKSGEDFDGLSAEVQFKISGGAVKIILAETQNPIKRIRVHWDGDFSGIRRVLGDSMGVAKGNLAWLPVIPENTMPWYFCAYDGTVTHGYGVKTGCGSFCYWQMNSRGVTLLLDVRNGGDGVIPAEPLLCAEVVEREGKASETAFAACSAFCGMMCDKPVLPKRPVYGLNNWYYAYGNISRASVLEDAQLAAELCCDTAYRPYLLIDDGWQKYRTRQYIGGPFLPNDKFGDMQSLAGEIDRIGCEPGLWIRPLLTRDALPKEFYHPRGTGSGGGLFLDPSNEHVLEYVKELVANVVNDGYKIIKYDFTAPDMLTTDIYDEIYLDSAITDENWHFNDRSKTNAQICKALYEAIREAAGETYLIGCNTYNHLCAGINEIQRSGLDTSGTNWDVTRKNGINSLAFRQMQNKKFFLTDADCPAFTEHVSIEMNMRFLEVSALASNALFTSITPGLLNREEKKRVSNAFMTASKATGLEPLDWLDTSCPARYLSDGREYEFNWFEL